MRCCCWGAMGLFVPCLGWLRGPSWQLAIEGSRAGLGAEVHRTDEHVPEMRSHV
jgi:hypothetical protein